MRKLIAKYSHRRTRAIKRTIGYVPAGITEDECVRLAEIGTPKGYYLIMVHTRINT